MDLWDLIERAKIPMDNICGDYFRNRKYIGSKDRADVAERVYSLMRARAHMTWWRDRIGLDHSARSRTLIYAILIDGRDFKNVTDLCDGGKYSPDPLSDQEHTALKKLEGQRFEHPDMPVLTRVECPEWAEDPLRAVFGDEFESEMEAMIPPAHLDVRVNTIKAARDDVRAMLEKQDIDSIACPYSPVGLRLTGKAFLSKTKAFAKGLIEIQDEGSQILAALCCARPGMQVLDYCAGGGGKTLALAAEMEGKGRIVAMDIEERRLAKAKPRLTKAGIHNFELRPIADDKHRKWFKRQKDKFDVVLIDAPCSSSGTWRRNPDLRWNTYGPTREAIQGMQADILEKVAHSVKPGGRLVYATCSLFRTENEDQIELFLNNHPEFSLIPAAKVWEESSLQDECPVDGDMVRLTPYRHGTDGFFAAIMEKRA